MLVAKSNKSYIDPLNVGFDVTGNLIEDVPAIANFAGSPSYTYSSDYVIRRNIGILAYDIVELSLRDASMTNYGTATYNAGDLLASATPITSDTEWSTTYLVADYIGATSTIEDTGLFEFDKKSFAEDNNLLNSSAEVLYLDTIIKTATGIVVGSSTLTLDLNSSLGNYNNSVSITISSTDNKFYVGDFATTNNAISQERITPGYNTRNFATTNLISQVGRIKVNTDVNTFGDLLYTDNTELWFAKGVSDDVDGFTVFGTPTKIGGNYSTGARNIEFLDEEVNGEKVLLSAGGTISGTVYAFLTYEWDGISAWDFVGIPFSGSVFSSGTFGNINTARGNMDRSGNSLFLSYYWNLASQMKGIASVSYTGDYRDKANWTRININLGFTVDPTLGGVDGARGIWVDDVNLVNGYPTIYLANFTYNVIQKITANKVSPLVEADFDTIIIAGTYGVAGNADGIGLAATFTNPFDLDGKDGVLYVVQYTGANNIRAIDLTTLQVTDFRGDFGVTGTTLAKTF